MENDPAKLPLFEPDPYATYSIDVVAEQTGVGVSTILHYQEQGLIFPLPDGNGPARYDDEALRTLRRIEHLRAAGAMNLSGMKLLLELLSEVERLRADLRSRR